MQPRFGLPHLGFGLGLRSVHFDHILRHEPTVDWFEVISENFMNTRGKPRYVLDRIAERYPVVMHGVSLSIGSADPLNLDYLQRLKRLADEIKPQWVSDHLCWTGVLGRNTHDLLPMPLNEDTLKHVVGKIKRAQEVMERRLVFENPSTYLNFADDTLSEWDFLSAMAEESDCGLLIDVNNVYVSSVNHEFDPREYLQAIPKNRIVQFHLAGHSNFGTHLIDTHDGQVIEEVWALYHFIYQQTQGVSTLLEWDSKIPDFPELHAEVLKAKTYAEGDASLEKDPPAAGSPAAAHTFDDSPPTGAHPFDIASKAM